MKIMVLMLIVFLTIRILDAFTRLILRRKGYVHITKVDKYVDSQVKIELEKLVEKLENEDQDYYEIYESPLHPMPIIGSTDMDFGIIHAKRDGILDPFVVKTTIGKHKEHMEELREEYAKGEMSLPLDNKGFDDDDDWDEELLGKRPDGEI